MSENRKDKELIIFDGKEQIKKVYAQICHYEQPEQLFGDLGNTVEEQQKTLSNAFKYLIRLYHPDLFLSDPEEHQIADNITKMLNYLRMEAEKKIGRGLYGRAVESESHEPECIITTAKREYRVIRYLIRGDDSDIYHAEFDDPDDRFMPVKNAVIKIADNPSKNHLIKNEVQVLKILSHQSLPELVDDLLLPEERKRAVITRMIDGHDLYQIRESFPDGLDERHTVWVFERLLSVLGFLHYHAILHGNIEPGNIMMRGRDHNAFLLDFNYSLVEPGKGEALEIVNTEYTAPEVFEHKAPHPASDMYSLGRCMIYLLGGEAEKERIPDRVDRRIVRFLEGFLIRNPGRRANDAWKMYSALSDLRLKIFGARHEFYPFIH